MGILQRLHGVSAEQTGRTEEQDLLEFEDIQHFLMTRPPARAARYEFLAFGSATGGRAWLAGLLEKVGTAKAVGSSVLDSRWVTVGFTWSGLRALGVTEASLATFPDEFRQGMAARAGILGLTGGNQPDHWVGGMADPTCTPLPSCSPAMSPNASDAGWSMRGYLNGAKEWNSYRRSIWRRLRRSITPTNTLAIAIGFRSRSSRVPAKSQRPDPAQR